MTRHLAADNNWEPLRSYTAQQSADLPPHVLSSRGCSAGWPQRVTPGSWNSSLERCESKTWSGYAVVAVRSLSTMPACLMCVFPSRLSWQRGLAKQPLAAGPSRLEPDTRLLLPDPQPPRTPVLPFPRPRPRYHHPLKAVAAVAAAAKCGTPMSCKERASAVCWREI